MRIPEIAKDMTSIRQKIGGGEGGFIHAKRPLVLNSTIPPEKPNTESMLQRFKSGVETILNKIEKRQADLNNIKLA